MKMLIKNMWRFAMAFMKIGWQTQESKWDNVQRAGSYYQINPERWKQDTNVKQCYEK